MNAGVLGIALTLLAPMAEPAPSAVPSCSRPVQAVDAARRATALGFLASRAWLELQLPRVVRREELKEFHRRQKLLEQRAEDLQLGTVMTLDEYALLRRDLGTWDRQQVNLSTWATEGAGTLLWTLGVQPTLPSLAGPMSLDIALRPIMVPGAAEKLQSHPRLRTSDEMARAWGEAQLFQWRFAVEAERRKQGGNSKTALPADVADSLKRAIAARLTSRSADGDLLAGTTPVPRVSNTQLSTLVNASRARADALRWVCGER